jgi:oxygen-independent coproporphyrinogen-3 oxidase
VRVGLDHFARPDDPLARASREGRLGRNFQGYVVHATERLIGVGASAISDSGRAYWQNHVDVATWTEEVLAGRLPIARGVALDADDELRRFVIMRLMCDGHVDFADVERRYGVAFAARFAHELDRLAVEHAALAAIDHDRGAIAATPLGHHLIRNVAAVFDRYAGSASGSPSI